MTPINPQPGVAKSGSIPIIVRVRREITGGDGVFAASAWMDDRFSRLKEFIEAYAPYGLLAPIMRRRYRPPVRAVQQDNAEAQFSTIYSTGAWNDPESVSGTGSSVAAAAKVASALPDLCRRHGVKRFVDLPCGDFNWMQHVDLPVESYVGGDIVPELVESDRRKYGRPGRDFVHLDLIHDPLPSADLLMVRDCFIHLPLGEITRALDNIRRSDITYLLTTTYPWKCRNWDIDMGGFRPVNLQAPPFFLRPPIEMIDDNETETTGPYKRFLALWCVKDL